MRQIKFHPGQIVATPGAIDAMAEAGVDALSLLKRHLSGDWGDMDEEDKKENDFSLLHGFRIFSSYNLPTKVTIWVITEADRSATTLLLPSDY